MKRTRWPAVAVALGLFGTAHGDDVTWRASSTAAPPLAKPVAVTPLPKAIPKPAPKPKSAAELVWRASSNVVPASASVVSPVLASDDSIWKPAGSVAAPKNLPVLKPTPSAPRVIESSTGDLAPPRVIEGELSLGPRVDKAVVRVAFWEDPSPALGDSAPVLKLPDPKPILPSLPEAKPREAAGVPRPIPIPLAADAGEIPLPPIIDKLTKTVSPESAAPKPKDMPIVLPVAQNDPPVIVLPLKPSDKLTLQAPVPPPMPKPKEIAPPPMFVPGAVPQSVLAPPVVTAPKPAMPTIVAADESTAIWGGYNSMPLPAGAEAVPGGPVACDPAAAMNHGVYGSANLRLSRDYNFLDVWTRPMTGSDDEKPILFEKMPAPVNGYFAAEYLMWWVRNGDIPILATTATGGGFGTLGDARTTALIGPGSFGDSERNGVRLRAGYWLNDCHDCGLDASVFVLGRQTNSITVDSAAFPTLARPFFAANFGAEFSELVAFPGLSTGRLVVEQTSFLWGADVNFRKSICSDCDRSLEWFAGYRYLNLQETLNINEFITSEAGSPDPVGTKVVVHDGFTVKNNFNGGQAGLAGGWRFGNVTLDLRGSIALGDTTQTLTIDGYQTKTPPGQPTQTFTGGLLAVGPNLGNFERNKFSVVPEATFNLGYFVLPHLKAYVGYNFLGWTNVIRPGEQIDRVVDLTYVPNAPSTAFSGQARPQPVFAQSNLFIQGITFGVAGTW